MKKFILKPGELTLADIRLLIANKVELQLDEQTQQNVNTARQTVENIVAKQRTVYGINTGFGLLANTKIEGKELEQLQHNIVTSHAAGTGELLDDEIVRLILLLKINSLARAHSGVRLSVLDALIALFNNEIYPCIPSKGSVGASGDLAPLAHLSLILLGEGEARVKDKIIPATEALAIAELKPISLAAKEGLALLNGTQVSTALAIYNLLQTEQLFSAALVTGALSVEALKGSHGPFDSRIHAVRNQAGQIEVAGILRELLADSEIQRSHVDCEKVQDPYSLRCQPQVMGACLTNLKHAASVLIDEANAVTDNPLVFAEDNEIVSGGNFHAEPVAIVADLIAICVSEIGAIAERRLAILVDPSLSNGLPAFLVNNPGVNSGFMLAQVTAAALASENKTHTHPASIDSMPTSANQEDHVSMATFAARRLAEINDNVAGILAIEYLAACQGIDFRAPLKTSEKLQAAHEVLRAVVSNYDKDRYFAPDIETAKQVLLELPVLVNF